MYSNTNYIKAHYENLPVPKLIAKSMSFSRNFATKLFRQNWQKILLRRTLILWRNLGNSNSMAVTGFWWIMASTADVAYSAVRQAKTVQILSF